MGHGSVILALAVLLTTGFFMMGTQRDNRDADDALHGHQHKIIARDAAQSALSVVVRRLAADSNMGSWTTGSDYSLTNVNFGSATVDVTVTPMGVVPGDTVDVVAIGRSGGVEHTLDARYVRAFADGGIPPSFRNVISTELQLKISGNLLVAAIDRSFNASIHTNDIILEQGQSFLIEGYGTFYGDKVVDPKIEERFVPNVDFGHESNYFQVEDKVHLPKIDAARLLSQAGESGAITTSLQANSEGVNTVTVDFRDPNNSFWSENNIAYNCASPPCGTETNPFVLYVDGPATFAGRIRFEGYGIIYGADNVVIEGGKGGGRNVDPRGVFGSIDNSGQTQVLLATKKNITIGDNTCLGLGPDSYKRSEPVNMNITNQNCTSDNGEYTHGLSLYAEGNVEFQGTPFLVGGIVSPSAEFSGQGNPWIAYAAPNQSIIDPGFEYIIPIGPILIAYSEF
jgi:hypothetical protein